MSVNSSPHPSQIVENKIYSLRRQKVILDKDLAVLYEVPTFRFNEAVKRNRARFPADFLFQLTQEEFADLISQNAISSKGHGGVRKLPWAFTEHGAIMAANILKSDRAVEMSVFVVRAFIKMRENLVLTEIMEKRLAIIEKKLLLHDSSLRDLYDRIRPLLIPPPEKPKRRIGFLDETRNQAKINHFVEHVDLKLTKPDAVTRLKINKKFEETNKNKKWVSDEDARPSH